jgi:hypothetical protein
MEQKEATKWVSFKVDVTTFIAICVAMYLAYSSHQANLENTRKLGALLAKYEQTLDTAIASDKVTLAQYEKNVKNALSSLSEEERALLKQLLDVDAK